MRKKIFGILVGVMMVAGAMVPVGAYAAGNCQGAETAKFFGLDPWYAGLTCESDGKTIAQSNFNKDNIGGTVASIVGVVAKDLAFLVGMASVIMVIVGGIQFIMSSGNPSAVAKAQKTIQGALTGLVLGVLAYAIVTFIMKVFGGM